MRLPIAVVSAIVSLAGVCVADTSGVECSITVLQLQLKTQTPFSNSHSKLELINEPFAGTVPGQQLSCLEKKAQKRQLQGNLKSAKW